jgi:hypothetical protein
MICASEVDKQPNTALHTDAANSAAPVSFMRYRERRRKKDKLDSQVFIA